MISPLPTEAVANWFILKAKENGESITVMKLQKLMYYAHGWCLALYNVPLVKDQIQAWTFGPAFSLIYSLVKEIGSAPIQSLLCQRFSDPIVVQDLDPRIPLLEKIWEVFGQYSDSQLSRMTTVSGAPWEKTISANPGRKKNGYLRESFNRAFLFTINRTIHY